MLIRGRVNYSLGLIFISFKKPDKTKFFIIVILKKKINILVMTQ